MFSNSKDTPDTVPMPSANAPTATSSMPTDIPGSENDAQIPSVQGLMFNYC